MRIKEGKIKQVKLIKFRLVSVRLISHVVDEISKEGTDGFIKALLLEAQSQLIQI